MWLKTKRIFGYFKLNTFRVISSLCVGTVGSGVAYLAFNKVTNDAGNVVSRWQKTAEDLSETLKQRRLIKFATLKMFGASKKKIPQVQLNAREQRFIKFASVDYDGQLYMTPRDFLDAVLIQEPRPRLKSKILSEEDVNNFHDRAQSLKTSGKSKDMFRTLHDSGIVSYTEYLYLLSVLSRPKRAYQIAFNMVDKDGNAVVDKEEYLEMEKILSSVWKEKRGLKKAEERKSQWSFVDDESGLQKKHTSFVNTTLRVFFFGKEGNDQLNFETYYEFMSNLLNEILELEFSEFAKGYPTISEFDFVRALVRFAHPDHEENEKYLQRLLSHNVQQNGISFEEFKFFCRFLNHPKDFFMAVRMAQVFQIQINEEQFHHIVKISSNVDLSPHLIHIVFVAFDEGNGILDHRDFISAMRHRQKRLFRSKVADSCWKKFKGCVNEELKKANTSDQN